LPADELPLWVAAQGALKPHHHAASWQRHFGLTREEAEAMLVAIADALDDQTLTREAGARPNSAPRPSVDNVAYIMTVT
jgi:hypothetical protein